MQTSTNQDNLDFSSFAQQIKKPWTPPSTVLIIYTGGTFGMAYDAKGKHLIPFDFESISHRIPELNDKYYDLSVISLKHLIDSSEANPDFWLEIAKIIEENYTKYDGFVVLHGTDTMAYTASALSFIFENLNKPVILTGAQLPIGSIRSDAKRNLITSIEIAGAKNTKQEPIVPEVCIFFNNRLLRGNRATKTESDDFNAFTSPNHPSLAKVGVNIHYKHQFIKPYEKHLSLILHKKLEPNVTILKIFPGISKKIVEAIVNIDGLKGLILETFGAGNAPTEKWFVEILEKAIKKGIFIVNVSQCLGGEVLQGYYGASTHLENIGVLSGADICTESALCKLMYLLSKPFEKDKINNLISKSLRGEML